MRNHFAEVEKHNLSIQIMKGDLKCIYTHVIKIYNHFVRVVTYISSVPKVYHSKPYF